MQCEPGPAVAPLLHEDELMTSSSCDPGCLLWICCLSPHGLNSPLASKGDLQTPVQSTKGARTPSEGSHGGVTFSLLGSETLLPPWAQEWSGAATLPYVYRSLVTKVLLIFCPTMEGDGGPPTSLGGHMV